MQWSALHTDSYNLLDQYWTGNMGIGPWAIVDPSAMNLLLPNQASATTALGDTTGWKTSTGATNEGTLLSNSTASFIHRTGATRSLQWQFTTSPITTPTLSVKPPYRNWYGIPVFPTLPYAMSAWLKPDGVVDTSITVDMRIRWLDSAGATLSDTASGATAVTTWQKLTATANAPAGAAYAMPMFLVTGSSVITGGSLYIDEVLFEQDSVFNNWAPGVGCRAVEIVGLTDRVTFETRMRKGCDMNLLELAA
jgi:hypothetical protein